MERTPLLQSIKLSGLLSFAPDSATIPLTALNVLIGPNGSGKSNLIEALELLRATPTAFAAAIREGGGAQEWMWKGAGGGTPASVEAVVTGLYPGRALRYRLSFAAVRDRTEILDEVLEEASRGNASSKDPYFYYRYQKGRPVLNVREPSGSYGRRALKRADLIPDESVLSQRKGADVYPEITWLGQRFGRIHTFREWSFGRYAPLRRPQPADLPSDMLLPDSRNLGLVLNDLEHRGVGAKLNQLLKRFLPRFQRFSTRVQGGTVQFYLHEDGLDTPVAATRLSDGTVRFLAMLALLVTPVPPPLVCIEEPELGLHPDAITLLADLLVDAADRTQLVVTTHSGVLVSALTDFAGSVLVCEHRRGTVIKRLDPDKLAPWLEDYRLGEVWRIGELGGNP